MGASLLAVAKSIYQEETVSKRKKPSNWNFINKGLQMWAPDQWKVNKGKIVIRRSQSSTIAPCQRIQDSLGFSIPFHGFWIPGAGFQSFPVELGSSRFHHSGVLEFYSGFQSPGFRIPYQNFPGLRILQAKIFQILESGYPYMGRSTSQTFSDQFKHI